MPVPARLAQIPFSNFPGKKGSRTGGEKRHRNFNHDIALPLRMRPGDKRDCYGDGLVAGKCLRCEPFAKLLGQSHNILYIEIYGNLVSI